MLFALLTSGFCAMRLQIADWHDYLKVLHETVHIWSAGLSACDYQCFLRLQQSSPWFKKNCRLYVLKDSCHRIEASCKLYSLNFSSRGRLYRLAGLGAVYTQSACRNLGLATELINDVLDLCEEDGLDGVVLFSEIAKEFYQDFGFEPLGSGSDFEMEPTEQASHLTTASVIDSDSSAAPFVMPLSMKHVPLLDRHYNHWLRRQPYGITRDAAYWRYKVQKEEYLGQHVLNGRPGLELGVFGPESSEEGYLIGERTEDCLRILEIVGAERVRKKIWSYLLGQLLARKIKRLSGWESLLRDMVPSFQVRGLELHFEWPAPSSSISNANRSSASDLLKVFFRQRTWGQGMIHVLNPQLEDWLQIDPCPLLELDHL
jgi:GNAT superfamily N-acetyltransferase